MSIWSVLAITALGAGKNRWRKSTWDSSERDNISIKYFRNISHPETENLATKTKRRKEQSDGLSD